MSAPADVRDIPTNREHLTTDYKDTEHLATDYKDTPL